MQIPGHVRDSWFFQVISDGVCLVHRPEVSGELCFTIGCSSWYNALEQHEWNDKGTAYFTYSVDTSGARTCLFTCALLLVAIEL